MPRLLFFVIFLAFTVFQLESAAVLNNYYQNEIHQGRCTGDKLVDEDIVKSGSLYTTKKLTYTWRGNNMYHITCINLYNKMSSSQAGSAKILEGGVGQSVAILDMMTKNGKGMHFHLEIYGQETRRSY